MSTDDSELKMMLTAEIAEEIAEKVGMENYDPDSYDSDERASFTKEERRKIYEAITGESGHDLSRIELNFLIMQELGTELDSQYQYEFSRKDLKIIHQALFEE